MDDLLDDFIAETRETLQSIEGAVIAWERAPDDRETLDSIFRFVHTVKGSCGFLDLPRLTTLSHAAENALDAVRQNELVASQALVTAVLAIIDRIAAVTNALDTQDAIFDDDHLLIQRLGDVCSGAAMIPVPAPEVEPPRERRDPQRAALQRNRSARLSLDLLDNLMSGISDMVLARNEMARRLREDDVSIEVDQLFSRLSSSIAQMRDSIGLVRLQPIDRLFVSFPRLVRDTALDLKKDILLKVEGGDVEIDREMVDVIRDPIMHILRNSVDHGIETPEVRRAAGKAAQAVIHLSAQQAGNQIVIEVADDGRGLDTERICAKAIAKGIIGSEQAATMSQRDMAELIFEPGFSTSEAVTDLSGRGVGMDVVRHAIDQMGGTIELRNNPGHGLTIVMRLPLTLSIMPGLTLRCGNTLFAIPRSTVTEILSLKGGQVRIDRAGGKQVASIRGARMACVSLAGVLGVDSDGPGTVIVVSISGGRRYALAVDAVVDHEELVVKPAPPLLMASGLYAGISLPDNGRPIMLLDASGIAEAGKVSDQIDMAAPKTADATHHKAKRALMFLSMTGERKAVRLSVLDRMKEVPASTVRHRGGALRFAHEGRHGVVLGCEGEPQGENVKLLRLMSGENGVLMMVQEILDIIDLEVVRPAIGTPMVEAVIEHEGEQIELIDAHACLAEGARLQGSDLGQAGGALCYLEADQQGWMGNVLKPLLEAAGYRGTHDPEQRASAWAELLSEDGGHGAAIDSSRTILLHDRPGQSAERSIYRYDRAAILRALANKAVPAGIAPDGSRQEYVA